MSNKTLSATAASVAIPDGINANCSIINNSGVDIMVLDGSSATGGEVLFEQDLKVLPSNGSNVIKNGTTGTVLLDDSYIDPHDGTLQYSLIYNLIIVRADNLFPIKVVSELEDYDNYDYPGVTVTAADLTCMQESQKFQQTIQAYPDSLLAQQFVAACQDSMDTSGSDKGIDGKVDAFFGSTDNYKNVTLNSLTAVQTYWGAYPFVWAGYAASKSYYIYTGDGSSMKSLGSLDITAPATGPASIDKSFPGFTLKFSPADNSASTPLKYINGQFVDSVETTSISLKGVYQLKSQFTNVATDNVITAFMTGSVYGDKALGFNEKPTQDSKGNWSGFYAMLHPKDAAGWLALILEIGAVVMTLELFSRPLKWLKDKFLENKAENKGKDPTKEEADKLRSDAKGKQSQDMADAQRTMDRMSPEIKIKITLDVKGTITELQADRADRITEDSRSNYTDITNRQAESLKTISKYSVDATVQDIAKKIGDNKKTLDPKNTDTEALKEKLDTVKTNVSSVETNLPLEAAKVQSLTSTAEQKDMADASEANEEAQKRQEEIEKNKKTSDKGDNDDDSWDDDVDGHGEE